jgi:predicted nucleotidyltransferase
MSSQSEDFVKILNAAGVEYVVIGGVAMIAQGSAYVTFDFDACYRRSKENIQKLCRALQPLHVRLRGAPADLPFRFDEKTVQKGLNFTLSTDLGDIDLLGEVPGLGFYDAVVAASEVRKVAASECRILSLEGLIRSKNAAGRAKDLQALKELQALLDLKNRVGGS